MNIDKYDLIKSLQTYLYELTGYYWQYSINKKRLFLELKYFSYEERKVLDCKNIDYIILKDYISIDYSEVISSIRDNKINEILK